MITGIDHVQLAMPEGEEEKAKAFYGGVLGLEELEKPEALKPRGGVWFFLGDGQLHLGVQEPFTPASKAHPAFRVAGLQALAQTLEAHGYRVSWDELLPGARRFYTQDPFGNRLEFLEPSLTA